MQNTLRLAVLLFLTGSLQPAGLAAATGSDWWSLRELERPSLPAPKDRSRVKNPIDAFVLATLEAKGLKPSASADRGTLIRRATFDLHGLPPTPEAIDAFLNDSSPRAYENLIDRLLASPRYGERWGRHWLDVAHYGDTHGYDKDKRRDHAWPYRDYVIRSFNEDKRYDRFIKEQIAGDVLYAGDPNAIIATGFVAAGPWDFVGHVELREGTVDKEKTRLLDRDDMVANAISTFLSLTAHCARCHDHKFDPIPQKDYYRLQSVFAGVDRGDRAYRDPDKEKREVLENRRKDMDLRRAILLHSVAAGAGIPLVGPSIGTPAQVALGIAARERGDLEKRLKALAGPSLVYALAVHSPRPIYRLHRGDVEQPREAVTPGGLSCVGSLSADFTLTNPNDESSRRAALANWIADGRNILTWRSIVNRVWHYHFGKGLVDTPNDFGRNGAQPTHPELLDWLAVEFRDGGQSFKKLHRLILLSSTYRQASTNNAEFARLDADNRYFWRMNRQRLDAEEIRDSVLAVSGKLDLTMGGPGFELFRFKDDHSPVYDHGDLDKISNPATFRRTVYRFVVRSVPNPFLDCLDCADPNLNTPVRNTTLTALQALALLNDPFMVKQAECLAERLGTLSSDPEWQVETAYRLALGRTSTAEEREALVSYAQRHGLPNACRLLFNMNEFVFVD